MSFCEKNEIHLVSDEVYALSTYDTDSEDYLGFTSVLSINPSGLIDENRLHILYGMSKVSRGGNIYLFDMTWKLTVCRTLRLLVYVWAASLLKTPSYTRQWRAICDSIIPRECQSSLGQRYWKIDTLYHHS